MSYIGLGSRELPAALDATGLNDGNWTNAFTTAVLTSKVAYYEIYTMSATDVPALATVRIYVGSRIRSTALLAGDSEWDPSQPILMTPDDELYACWDQAAAGVPPVLTVWMRYDPAIQPRGAP